MPRYVDHEERRRQIIDATTRVLAEHGPRGLTIRSVARVIGGSSTMVTHYFSTRDELIEGVIAAFAQWPATLESLERGYDDPRDRLRVFLHWSVPGDEQGLTEERARMNLLADRSECPPVDDFLVAIDTWARDLIADHLEGLVAPEDVAGVTDLIRVLTNGIALAAVEHPDDWPASRQYETVDHLLELLGLLRAD